MFKPRVSEMKTSKAIAMSRAIRPASDEASVYAEVMRKNSEMIRKAFDASRMPQNITSYTHSRQLRTDTSL